MLKAIAGALAALGLLALCPLGASGRPIHGNGQGSPCPYAATAQTYDGCAGAPRDGAFFDANLAQHWTFNAGHQNGFVTPSVPGYPHPPPFDIPGMDRGYHVSYSTGTPLKIPTYNAGTTNLPAGCAFSPTVPTPPYHIVCKNLSTASGSYFSPITDEYPSGQVVTGAFVMDHYDFDKISVNGVETDGVCVSVDIAGTVSVPRVITNNHFKTENDCIGANLFLLQMDNNTGTNAAYFFNQNEVDGNYPTLQTSPFNQNQLQAAPNSNEIIIKYANTNNGNVLYNYIHNCRTRCMDSAVYKFDDFEFNVGVAFNLVIGAGNIQGSVTPDPAGGAPLLNVTGWSGNNGVTTGGAIVAGSTTTFSTTQTILYQLSGPTNGGTPSNPGVYKLAGDPCRGGAPCAITPAAGDSVWGVYEDNQHGEVQEIINPFGTASAPMVMTGQSYRHNFVAVPNFVSTFAGTTTNPIYMQQNSDTQYSTITYGMLDSNVEITNLWYDASNNPHTNVSSAGSNISYNIFTNLTIQNNWIDPNGATQCYSNPGTPTPLATFTNPPTFTGNYSLYDGSPITANTTGTHASLFGTCAGASTFK